MIKVEINCEPNQMDEHLRALGFMRLPFVGTTNWAKPTATEFAEHAPKEFAAAPEDDVIRVANPTPAATANGVVLEPGDKNDTEADARFAQNGGAIVSTRKPGEPAPGRKRRTKEELAEDEAYFKVNPTAASTQLAKSSPSGSTASASGAAISTGDARVDPAVVAQDEADEAAESAANRDGKLTLDDVRHAFGVYARKVGMPAAIGSIRDILGSPLNDVPQTQEALAKAIESINTAMGAPGPVTITQDFLPKEPEPPVHGTKAECYEALRAYGRKYDGSTEPAKMANTMVDGPEILTKLFGKKVTGFSAAQGGFPESPENYGRALAAINAAVRDNPFKRQVHA